MVNILPKVPGFGERLGTALGGGLGQGFQQGMSRAQEFAQQMELEKQKAGFKKKSDETEKFSTGMDVLQQMRQVASRGKIGRGSAIMGFFPGETAHDRAEFEQLGKSLIPIVAAGVPIRNQREFDEYKKVITDPSSSLDAIEGAIKGLESIFQQKLEGKGDDDRKGKIKFNPQNKEHKAKAEQLFKKFGNKEKVREALKREFEGI